MSAKVILDSISPEGHRLTTMEVVMHRFVLAEFNTHRVFSRNSASSRAIPVSKQMARVRDDPAVPLSFPTEQSGMQGGVELTGEQRWKAEKTWRWAKEQAILRAEELQALGVHKSVVNRLLEPFMWHTVIVSSTEWSNFFGLRCNPMAQPEIRAAADAMRAAYESSTPRECHIGKWHLPYLTEEDGVMEIEPAKKVSAARCARVSYLTHDGVRDHDKDVELYERLTSAVPSHASPLEHVATPCRCDDTSDVWPFSRAHLGNFTGWDQFRHQVIKEA